MGKAKKTPKTPFDVTLKDFYTTAYPSDALGAYMAAETTFAGLWETLEQHKDVYDYIGGDADSIIRERLFKHLANIMRTSYNTIYDKWLEGAK